MGFIQARQAFCSGLFWQGALEVPGSAAYHLQGWPEEITMHATLPLLKNTDFPPIRRARLETLQVNLGLRCNQQCLHCHVNAGPRRKEQMTRSTVEEVLGFLRRSRVTTLDLTGGAPELNPNFRYLVTEAGATGVKLLDRCNLTILGIGHPTALRGLRLL